MTLADPTPPAPFADFLGPRRKPSPLRAAIDAAHRPPETECIPPLIAAASVPSETAASIRALTMRTVRALRAKGRRGGVEGLIHEYALSSQEGVALMCLAEALLRTPDNATRDRLIRDKIAPGNWQSHLGHGRSLFVNAATWGLVVTGRLVSPVDEQGLSQALTRLVARSGEPVIRSGVNLAMKMMGEQFVAGQTIAEALRNGREMEAEGFRYSYDMLGEAAVTARDAARYMEDYRKAIHAIGKAANGKGIYDGSGISIKLSALHPRYSRAQYHRVIGELLPRVIELAVLARSYDIGLNIDAEEADRLDSSLDILEALCAEPRLAGWNGIGFVVQAYAKRCPAVIDFLIDLARRTGHRLMVRLVKGAYWDAEIKRAQIDGVDDFPVYTRKVHTDVAYIACARKLLAAKDVVYPQFATHNAQTMATIFTLAGPDFRPGDYEFQCLHGMGEPLYEEVVGKDKLDRPCRIYAPVGSHDTLLAYLVRRLLENGANSSFVHRIADKAVPAEALAADPAVEAAAIVPQGSPHPAIQLPRHILANGRINSRGIDLASEPALRDLAHGLAESAAIRWAAGPTQDIGLTTRHLVLNPADHRDLVGTVEVPSLEAAERALAIAASVAERWNETLPAQRAACLRRAAELMEAQMQTLMGLAIREAGKAAANAVSEVREAVDFLRYYADEAERGLEAARGIGPVVSISPWNFPLAIFTGQVAAALVAGNPVIAKPAEETPLIAAEAVRILHEAGIPRDVLQVLPGDGRIGAALVAEPRTRGVMFTGSIEVARLIQRQLAERILPDGRPVPLIAETGGQNALIVDSSALAEQVVIDVLTSAFDSAGQRCSALRVLCLQEEVAERTLEMLKGALAELAVGNPERLSTDVGPVITAEAQKTIAEHIEAMRGKGRRVTSFDLPAEAAHGTFIAPTIIEIDDVAELGREVFGPVLHVVRFRRDGLAGLIDRINALGYGLTFGLHTRIDTTIAEVTARIEAGNIYVNRNQIGAVVGVQPFGGHGLSGTGPKAGGPLYLRRLVMEAGSVVPGLPANAAPDPALAALAGWLSENGTHDIAHAARLMGTHPVVKANVELAGPVGERNSYLTRPRGTVLASAETEAGLLAQLAAILATGNDALVEAPPHLERLFADLPEGARRRVSVGPAEPGSVQAALVEGTHAVAAMSRRVAEWPGPVVTVQGPVDGHYSLDLLVDEISISTNTAAAGGNASLMALA
ncbi:trifunctional transcriptional regulator/proline dehydrogenase/L-glutamate gamma-semialdehyde dehydrogenase [Devosia nitrariae]|uniref:Bifunctional protein PutA n=1 Tax=Devosia nitrariae TaxID=2071872 RepID=A0ABQ5W4H2_9HYPH|nr:trifunctional transcriptional regulator/proline dehydrogenase/L-glutamate gamma-semialdehyde dehydrogenase [Devosia nitrariae]GLQ54840.1 bifunctional protein PutA [Devosia nitrariae]